jgi:hypothetical protein
MGIIKEGEDEGKEVEEEGGIDKYLLDDSDSEVSEDEIFEDQEKEEMNKNLQLLMSSDDGGNDLRELVDESTEQLLMMCKQFVFPEKSVIDKIKIKLGKQTRHKTLILDMDETLVHAMIHEQGEQIEDADFQFTLEDGGNDLIVSVKERPYWNETLTHLS